MCENICPATNCEVVNQCEGTTVVSAPTEEDAKSVYINGLLGDIKTLQNDLQNATRNQNRFQSLYCQALSSLLQIKEADSNIDTIKTILSGTFAALGDIEAKS